jgi:SAM-dependent methyltransferase
LRQPRAILGPDFRVQLIQSTKMISTETNTAVETDAFFHEYTSQGAILKYTKATAGFGISYLLDHDYKTVYLEAIRHLPQHIRQKPIRILEFGCGGGMKRLHLFSVLGQEGIQVDRAIGADFSPVLIEAAKREAKNHLRDEEQRKVEFHVAKNETLIEDLSGSMRKTKSELENSFHFILGVNTIRYCHRAGKQLDCSRDIFNLLAPGGVCVVIDMNDRFPAFRSALKNKLRSKKENEEECYLPSLEEYTAPFQEAGFEVSRSEHFCWIPHSAGRFMTGLLRSLSPALNTFAGSRAMRSVVVAKKPI